MALTARGERIVVTYEGQMKEAVAKMLTVLDAKEQENFIGTWEKIADAAEAADER